MINIIVPNKAAQNVEIAQVAPVAKVAEISQATNINSQESDYSLNSSESIENYSLNYDINETKSVSQSYKSDLNLNETESISQSYSSVLNLNEDTSSYKIKETKKSSRTKSQTSSQTLLNKKRKPSQNSDEQSYNSINTVSYITSPEVSSVSSSSVSSFTIGGYTISKIATNLRHHIKVAEMTSIDELITYYHQEILNDFEPCDQIVKTGQIEKDYYDLIISQIKNIKEVRTNCIALGMIPNKNFNQIMNILSFYASEFTSITGKLISDSLVQIKEDLLNYARNTIDNSESACLSPSNRKAICKNTATYYPTSSESSNVNINIYTHLEPARKALSFAKEDLELLSPPNRKKIGQTECEFTPAYNFHTFAQVTPKKLFNSESSEFNYQQILQNIPEESESSEVEEDQTFEILADFSNISSPLSIATEYFLLKH